MKSFRRFGLARAIAGAAFGVVLVTACGGGGDSPAPPASPTPTPGFRFAYEMPQAPSYPTGSIIVSPPPGRTTISDDGPVRAELELAGFPVQRLDAPNFQSADTVQLKYVFGLPQALPVEPPARCVYVAAKVTLTSVTGAASVATFQVCAGVGLLVEA